MDNLARRRITCQAVQEFGRIIGRENEIYLVETDSGRFSARRAVSCLVEPVPDDKVLIARGSPEEGYILTVLDRRVGEKTTLCFSSDVDIKAPEGRLGIATAKGIDLVSGEDMSLISRELGINACQGNICVDRLSFVGSVLEGSAGAIKVLAETLDSSITSLYTRARRSFRIVEELDQLKAGALSYLARKSLVLRGEFSQLTAEKDVHIDGERINIG